MKATSSAKPQTAEIIVQLRALHPDASCQLEFETPLELLVATILSAQCSNTRVNSVTPRLFAEFKTAEDYVAAPRQALEQIIRPTGFYRQKARYIQGACLILVNEYDGQVPDDMDALTRLPGVSRKTGNIVLSEAFGITEGVVVDTNVTRVAQRLELSTQPHPKQIEQDLMEVVPQRLWYEISHLLAFHGERLCHLRRPACARCTLSDICPAAEL